MTKAWLSFGLTESNYYEIMFGRYMPRYRDFVKAGVQDAANRELAVAVEVRDLVIDVITEIGACSGKFGREDASLHLMQWLTGMHGIVVLHNSTALSYIHDRPAEMLETLARGHLRAVEAGAMGGR